MGTRHSKTGFTKRFALIAFWNAMKWYITKVVRGKEGSCITPDMTRQRYVDPTFKKCEKCVKSVTRTRLAPCDLTKKKKKTFVVQDAIEDSAESHGRHTIRCLIRHKFEPYRGYIAEHPNDEEEVEGIDLHQQRYPWEGSDMYYLYDEVSISLDGLRFIFESCRL
ncbi:hypothetical protein YC2023_057527 [Brassica napus]